MISNAIMPAPLMSGRETLRLIQNTIMKFFGIVTRDFYADPAKKAHMIVERVIIMMAPPHLTIAQHEEAISSIMERYPAFETDALFRKYEYICFTKKAAKMLKRYGYTFVRKQHWATYAIV